MFMLHQLNAERRPVARRRRTVSTDQQDKIHLLKQTVKTAAQNMGWRYLRGHQSCVNAIEFGRGNLFASAGDDKRVLLWQTEDFVRRGEKACKPSCMRTAHTSNIFTLSFNSDGSALASAGNDATVITHDTLTSTQLSSFKQEHAILEVNFHPELQTVFLTADVDGCIRLFDSRDDSMSNNNNDRKPAGIPLARYLPCFHSVQFQPRDTRYFLTAHMNRGVALWDMRNTRTCMTRFGGEIGDWDCSCARFNAKGDRIVMLKKVYDGYALQVFATNKPELPLFRLGDRRYSNTATVKSCCFAGADDEYVCAGGDKPGHFGVFMWHLPSNQTEIDADKFIATHDMQRALLATAFKKQSIRFEDARAVKKDYERKIETHKADKAVLGTKHATCHLGGYRSITNQVRFDRERMLLATSGVENTIKLWSPLPFNNKNDDERNDDADETYAEMRNVYSLFDLLAASQPSSNSRYAFNFRHGAVAQGAFTAIRRARNRRRDVPAFADAAGITTNFANVEQQSGGDESETEYADEIVSPVLSPARVDADDRSLTTEMTAGRSSFVPASTLLARPYSSSDVTDQGRDCPTSTTAESMQTAVVDSGGHRPAVQFRARSSNSITTNPQGTLQTRTTRNLRPPLRSPSPTSAPSFDEQD